ncbi:MAG: PilZ domain-containing protein [Methylococcaceae bacterium]|nr:PilZ domain-containing protein [Methylococcaceae bacterium]
MKFEEMRRFARMKAICELSYKRIACEQTHQGRCVNIGACGILFEADMPIELGRALEIRTFPGDRITPPITAFIEVVRCTPQGKNRYGIAGVIKGIKSE